jgi:hypothetical protein
MISNRNWRQTARHFIALTVLGSSAEECRKMVDGGCMPAGSCGQARLSTHLKLNCQTLSSPSHVGRLPCASVNVRPN